jgi:hypothetical protein
MDFLPPSPPTRASAMEGSEIEGSRPVKSRFCIVNLGREAYRIPLQIGKRDGGKLIKTSGNFPPSLFVGAIILRS